VKSVNAKLLDFGAMSRPPKESELETGIEYVPFAEERVAVVTSPDLQIPSLSIEQIRAIFTGEIGNWSAIGGPDEQIRLIIREEDDSNTKIIRAGIIGDAPFSETALVMTREDDAKNALNNATYAIGYLGFSGIIVSALDVHTVSLDGLHPADPDIDYPLASRMLGVAFLPDRGKEFQGFVDFLTDTSAKKLLATYGLLAIK